MRFLPGNAQNIGARSDQQDSFGFSDPDDGSFVAHAGVAAVVADGMGGLAHGSAASHTAVDAFLQAYEAKEPGEAIPDALLRSIRSANQAVYTLWQKTGAADSLGTTLAAVVLHEDWLYWVSAGDSRVYYRQEGNLVQFTTDHVFAAELDEQVSRGHITREEAAAHPKRDALISYLGLETLPRVDRSLRGFPISPGDCVLICSDGLYRALSDEEISRAIEPGASGTCESLVQIVMAKRIATQDNVTVIALQCAAETAPSFRYAKPLMAAAVAVGLFAGGFIFWSRSVPRIDQFAVDNGRIDSGQSTVLRWSVNHGGLTITPDIGRVDQRRGTRSVTPRQKTRYTLTAQNFYGSASRSIDVEVTPKKTTTVSLPTVKEFRAEPLSVSRGGSVKLSWNVTGKVGDVRLNGQKVKPVDTRTIPNVQKDATYTLTAAGPQGQLASEVLQVMVSEGQPEITSFKAIPASIEVGTSAVLKWSVNGASSVQIQPAAGSPELKLSGTEKVNPKATTTYTLTANGKGDPVTAKVVVTVLPHPVRIGEFVADKPEIKAGDSATLSWNVTGEVRTVTIDNGIGTVKPVDRRKVTPASKTTYTLTAAGAGKAKLSKTVTVDILPVPKIETFAAFNDGQAWRLRWQVSGAEHAGTRISIDPGIGVVSPSSPPEGLVIPPPPAGQYTLTVEGPGGTASKDAPVQPPPGTPQ